MNETDSDDLEKLEAMDPEMASLNKFLRQSRQQDERGMVLSLAAFAEESLGHLLLVYLKDCKQTRDLVDGFNAPLGTLSARIKAAFSFGLLTDEQYHDLEIARKVRNAFAHDWSGITLDRNDIAALLGQLHCYTVDQRQVEGGRERLLESISCICLEVQVMLNQMKRGRLPRAPIVTLRLTTTKPN